MRSSRIIDESGKCLNLVSFTDSVEPYYLTSLKSWRERWDSLNSNVLEIMSTGQVHSVTITQGQASAIYNMLLPKLEASFGGDNLVSHRAIDAMNELFSHIVKISQTTKPNNWVKRPLRVSAMKYDGTVDSFNKVVKFTSLTPVHRSRDWDEETGKAVIPSLESDKILYPGNYAVRSIEGEFYPVREDIMKKSREAVKKEKPYPDTMPWIEYWDNKPVAVLAHQYTMDNYDVILELCANNNWSPPIERDEHTGVMRLPRDNGHDDYYVVIPGDIVLYERGGHPRVCREDIFRNTYKTAPDKI